MSQKELTSGDSEAPRAPSVDQAPDATAKLHGQNWLLVPTRFEQEGHPSSAIRGLQLSTIFGLLVSVFTIVGVVALFVNPRFDDVNQNIDRLRSEIETIEDRMTTLETSLTTLDGKLTAIGNMILLAFQDGELDRTEIVSIWQQASP